MQQTDTFFIQYTEMKYIYKVAYWGDNVEYKIRLNTNQS